MTAYVAVINRQLTGCSRNSDDTYVHVVTGYQSLVGFSSLAEWVLAFPGHDWNNTDKNEYAVELTEVEYNSLAPTSPYYDGKLNLPIRQQQAGNTGSTKAFGSYSDPTSSLSTWNLGVDLPDDRFILRVYSRDPVAEVSAVHLGEESFVEVPPIWITATAYVVDDVRENDGTNYICIDAHTSAAANEPGTGASWGDFWIAMQGGVVTRYMRLFSATDSPLNNNSADQRTSIGGILMDFDFGSSHTPSLSAGVTSFGVDTSSTGTVWFPSNAKYRFIGPIEGDPNYYKAEVYGKILRPEL